MQSIYLGSGSQRCFGDGMQVLIQLQKCLGLAHYTRTVVKILGG